MKIEDLTLKEIREICTDGLCSTCPLFGYWSGNGYKDCLVGLDNCSPSGWTTEDMERVIEGVNK